MPSPKVSKNNHRAGHIEAIKSVESFLKEKGIPSERVLDYVCFDYKGSSFRVREVLEAKIKMGIA